MLLIFPTLLRNGTFDEYKELKKKVPGGVIAMLSIPGLGPKKIQHIWKVEGVDTISGLEKFCRRGQLSSSPGFGKKTEEKILAGIDFLKRFSGKHLFSDAYDAASNVLERMNSWPGVIRHEIAGSLRRHREIIGDIDILVSANNPKEIMDLFTSMCRISIELCNTEKLNRSVILGSGIQCDLRVVSDKEFPFALHYFTGSKEHNVALRKLAKKSDIKMNEYGLFKGNLKQETDSQW